MHQNDYIKKFAVKIKYDDFQGTGVIIRSNNAFYIITAKHNFKESDSETHIDVKKYRLEKNINNIEIIPDNGNCTFGVCKILLFKEDLDLIIFSVENIPLYLKNIECIKILEGKHYDNNYFLYGYPIDKSGRSLSFIYSNEINDNKFRLDGIKNIREKYLSGFSGSGLFVKKDKIYYLVGMVIKSEDGLFNYEAINLSSLIDKIKSISSIESKFHIKNKRRNKTMSDNTKNNPVFNIGSNNGAINTGSGNQYNNCTVGGGESSMDTAMELFYSERYREAKDMFSGFFHENDDSKIYYIISSLSNVKISNIKKSDINQFYKLIENMSSNKYQKLSNYLWLIIFYEYTNTYSTPLKLDRQHKERRSIAFSEALNNNEKKIFSNINTVTEKSDLLSI
jgi:hypothetical protein